MQCFTAQIRFYTHRSSYRTYHLKTYAEDMSDASAKYSAFCNGYKVGTGEEALIEHITVANNSEAFWMADILKIRSVLKELHHD